MHEHHETALYMLSGDEMELWTGDQLQYRDIVQPGDYIFIPANMLHVAVNRGAQTAVFIGSRNEATAQESVVLRPEMDQRCREICDLITPSGVAPRAAANAHEVRSGSKSGRRSARVRCPLCLQQLTSRARRHMSVKGQKRTSWCPDPMSALPRRADLEFQVRSILKADLCGLTIPDLN